jgi:hypothetical protein
MAVGRGASKNVQSPSGGSTLIAMVQTTNFREGNDIAGRGRLYGTRPRAVLAERKMRSDVMMVLKIARQNATQMALVEDDDVIQAFSADRTDETLNVRVLPGRSRRSDDLRDPVHGEFVNPRKNGAGAFGFSALARQVHPQHVQNPGPPGPTTSKA